MPKEKNRKPKSTIEASATLTASAKVSYSRKKITTEVIPPDVTRAKAGSWLSLISPITEWAGLKGDALKYRRQQLRIQQEDSLLRLASKLRHKMAGHKVLHPVPAKLLVPALEKASLEDSSDDVMIDRWANLLASAAQDVPVQPRFVGILGELAGSQAECLERIAFNHADDELPRKDFELCPLTFSERDGIFNATALVQTLDSLDDLGVITNVLVQSFSSPGAFLTLIYWENPDTDVIWEGYDYVDAPGVNYELDLSVLESLGLIRHVDLEVKFACKDSTPAVLRVFYYHLTRMGVDLCSVCSRPKVLALKEKEDANLTDDQRTVRRAIEIANGRKK